MAWAAFLPEIAGAATEAAAGTAEAAGTGAAAVDAAQSATSESTASRMNNFSQGTSDHNQQDSSNKGVSLTVADVTSDVM